MPRQRRRLAENKIYHIMVRGNERKNLFHDDEDRMRFLNTLNYRNQECKYQIYAFCIMNNHVHLLLNEGSDEVSRIMKSINVSYAFYYNKKYDRVGHLFQDRFKSEIIDSDRYLLSAARYIHGNPVNAAITREASQYEWSSYNCYIGHSNRFDSLVYKDRILDLFSQDRRRAIDMFIQFSNQDNDDEFIEYKDEQSAQGKTISTEKVSKAFIDDYLKNMGITLASLKEKPNINHRNQLIRHLKEGSNLSIREMADILDLGRNIVQRVK